MPSGATDWVPCWCAAVKASFIGGSDPSARPSLGLGAVLGAEVGKHLIQLGIALAGSFGDDVPFQGLDLVYKCTLSANQHPGEAVLRDRRVLPRRLAQQRDACGLVLRRAGAVIKCDGIFDFGIDI